MKILLVLILFLPSFLNAAPSKVPVDSLNGVWKTVKPVRFYTNDIETVIDINGKNILIKILTYSVANPSVPYLERQIGGEFVAKKNLLNDQITDLDITLNKNVVILHRLVPELDKVGIGRCAKLNVPVDLMTSDCGKYKLKDAKKLFHTVMLQDKDTLLTGDLTHFASTESSRPVLLLTTPLVKK